MNNFRFIDFINEGGNVVINGIGSQKIYFSEIGIKDIRTKCFNLFEELNKIFFRKYNEYLWDDINSIKSGYSYNGSTSFIMDQNISPKEILKYKKSAGDIDITIPAEYSKKLYFLFKELENKKIKDFEFIGQNRTSPDKLGQEINTIFKLHTPTKSFNIQIDFEFVEYQNGRPTEWSKFYKGSSFLDMKSDIKGLFHKILLSRIVHTLYKAPDIIIATDKSSWDKIRIKVTHDEPSIKKLSGTKGLVTGIEPLKDPDGNQVYYDNKRVFKEIDQNDFSKDIESIFLALFKGKGSKSDMWSFIGVCNLLKTKEPKFIKEVLNKFVISLFNPKAKKLSKISEEDYTIKMNAYNKFVEITNISIPNIENITKKYYDSF